MIRVHSLVSPVSPVSLVSTALSILLVASATMLGGCVGDAGPDNDESSSTVDALVDVDGDDAAEEPTTTSGPAGPQLDAPRGTPRDSTDEWSATEPQPVPWRGNNAGSTPDDDDDPHPRWVSGATASDSSESDR